MSFKEMTDDYRRNFDKQINERMTKLATASQPIYDALAEVNVRHKTKIKCSGKNKIPDKADIFLKKPKLRVTVTYKGEYTVYDNHFTQYSFQYTKNVSLEQALEYLSFLIAKATVRSVCS